MVKLTAARLRVAVIAAAVVAVPAAMLTTTSAVAAPAADKTSAAEARRVDRVPTPELDWFDCSQLAPDAFCSTVSLPMDYDQPKGAKTSVAVLKIKATDPKHKIGTLFLNPGGPGGSGTYIAAMAPYFMSPEVLARFDIVGFDPRGTNFSDNVACWKDMGAQSAALTGMMDVLFPWTSQEKKDWIASSKAFGKACSTTGKPLTGSMSTAEVARDMDVLRRAVGDKQLTYLGFSYDTYLGTVYANLFPDRVRAVAIDGVIDPIGWAGTAATANVPLTTRIRSGEASARALHEALVRCAAAGADKCEFAGTGDPLANYATIITALKKAPLVYEDPDFGEITISYATLVGVLAGELYSPNGYDYVSADLTYVYTLMQGEAPAGSAAAAQQKAARAGLAKALARLETAKAKVDAFHQAGNKVHGFAFPYDNGWEAYQTVLCTDGLNPANAGAWSKYAAASDKSAPDFGPYWTWQSSPCASNTWTVQDEDTYSGPFTRRTGNPVLVIGNLWDPATNYDSAVQVASLLPNSRLLSSDNWGHTAYGTSECVTAAMDSYLLTKALPAKGTRCVGDDQPFTQPLEPLQANSQQGPSRQLPPVAPLVPLVPRS